jgi:hypothetical protein
MTRIAFRAPRPLAAALVLALLPAPAAAQLDFLTGIFDNVNSVTVALQGGRILDRDHLVERESKCLGIGLCGMAAEVLIDLPSAGGADLELGLGASFLRGFEAVEPTLDLHASLRSFPTLAAYAALPERLGLGIFDPYAGVSFGLTELWSARGYDAEGLEYEVEGSTFDLGVGAGVYLLRPRGLFIEASYRWRDFGSVDWVFPDEAEPRLPEGWPRELNLSGWMLSIGWQFRLRDADDKEEEEES